MSKLFVQVERVEDLIRREDDYFTQPRQKPKSITNADRIRRMTDEELAEWVWGVETAGRAYGPRWKAAWLDWLRQEAVSNG